MNKNIFLFFVVCIGNANLSLAQNSDSTAPNIVIIFTDDQGYADVGVYGAKGFNTPNLDQMATDGIRFTDFYVAQPVCSASRTALLTGCYPNRLGITGALGPNAKHGLHADETTLAELCKSKGYATAIYGKWHLGNRKPFLPTRHGFDNFYGIPYSNDMWPLHPDLVKLPDAAAKRKRGYPNLPIYEDDSIVDSEVTHEDQRQFTTTFTQRAVAFIDANKDQRFFLYLPHPMPHVPLHVSNKFQGKTEQGLYGDVISEIDWSVGQILQALKRNGLEENTLVIFMSDNGPWLSYGDHGGSTGPLREGKGTTFEGGVRVPCIMRWVGKIPPGSICREPMMTIDLFPTIAKFIGAELPQNKIDGRDASALVLATPNATSPQQAYYFYYHRNDLQAIRSGRWKLHFPHKYRSMDGRELGSGGTPGKYDNNRKTGLELYDLIADIGERRNVAEAHPEVVKKLTELADAMRHDLGDNLTNIKPTGNRKPGRIDNDQ
ncbi:MAG: sulfatase [Planctomycetes bacterium]|nr:sulfatase [Planctomycetota bacterium]